MNNARRKMIRAIIKRLQGPSPDWTSIESDLNDLLDEETDAMDNIPDSLQDTDRYQICEESVEYLDEAIGYIEPEDPDSAENVITALRQIDGI